MVTKGLNVGDRIVVEGVNKLSNDMEIKPITPQQSEAQQKKSQQHMAEKENAWTIIPNRSLGPEQILFDC